MTDRPIIFSAPMVRALLEGRKTQTRRIIKLNGRPPEYCGPRGCMDDKTFWGWEDHDHGDWVTLEKEPGQRAGWRDLRVSYAPGDRLWVRERHYLTDDGEAEAVIYTADDTAVAQHHSDIARLQAQYGLSDEWARPHLRIRPSIHMPRWASRLTLIVTDVRVQRVQEISGEDCVAEGVCEFALMPPTDADEAEARTVFRDLWNSLHGHEAWGANPWVLAIIFRTINANIDSTEATA